jgi:hypothetical protein
MKNLFALSVVALIAVIGFFTGRSIASTKSTTPAALNAGKAKTVPEKVVSPSLSLAKLEESPALTEAYEVLTGQPRYEDHSIFYGAVQHLNLEQVRELHRRVMAMPANSNLLDIVADRWVQLEPDYAADFVRSFPNGAGVIDRTGLVFAWARRSPESAIAEAIKSGKSSKATLLLSGAFATLAAKDPESAVSQLKLIADEKLRDSVFDSCLTTWARQDPIGATRWMQAHPDAYSVGSNGNESVAKFCQGIAVRDLKTALEFSSGLAEPLRQQALLAVASEWAAADPAAALSWCLENHLSPTEPATSSFSSAINVAMHRGPEKTAAWIASLPLDGERGEIAGYALRFAKSAMALKLFGLIPEADQPNYVSPYMKSLNTQKVGAALQWASSLPEGTLRVAALDTLMSEYRFKKPVETIDAFPPGNSRDAAYAAYIRKSSSKATAPDMEQLPKIADERLRQRVAWEAFNTWNRSDPAAARKWLEETPHIPAQWKARVKREE